MTHDINGHALSGSIMGKQIKSKDFTLTAANETDFLNWTQAIRGAIEGKSLRGVSAAAVLFCGVMSGQNLSRSVVRWTHK